MPRRDQFPASSQKAVDTSIEALTYDHAGYCYLRKRQLSQWISLFDTHYHVDMSAFQISSHPIACVRGYIRLLVRMPYCPNVVICCRHTHSGRLFSHLRVKSTGDASADVRVARTVTMFDSCNNSISLCLFWVERSSTYTKYGRSALYI